MSDVSFFIYCDSPNHATRVPIRNFERLDSGRWQEVWHARDRGISQSAALKGNNRPVYVGDEPVPEDVRAWAFENDEADRERFTLKCRKCKGVPGRPQTVLEVRDERLFAALDTLAQTGLTEAPLAFLAATVARQAELAKEPSTSPRVGNAVNPDTV